MTKEMPDRVGVILGELVNINVEYAEQIYLKSEQCPICGFPFKKEYRQNMVNQARSELLKVVCEEVKKVCEEFDNNWGRYPEHEYEGKEVSRVVIEAMERVLGKEVSHG